MSTQGIVELEEIDNGTFKTKVIVPDGKWITIDESNIRIDDFRQRNFCVPVD